MEVFDQTVWITVVGMGLTFGAIGLLVTAMILLTRWSRNGKGGAPYAGEPSGAIPVDEELQELEQAAAVAVAVAMAQATRRVHPIHAWHASRPEVEPSAWQAYARQHQLEQRRTHGALRRQPSL